MKKMLLAAFGLACCALPMQAQITVQVNCTQWVEHPLVKKIGLYQTPLLEQSWIKRDFPKLNSLEARSLRYEMACGKDDLYGQPCVGGTAEKPTYNLGKIDYLLTEAKKYTSSLVIAHGYTPTTLKSRPDVWEGFMDMPTNMETWTKINKRFAQEWKTKNYYNSYVEIWNEPDLTNGFFTGTVDDYLRLYETAAPAVVEGWADLKVGGPAGAFDWWHQPLVDRAKAKNLPLDFLSGHFYGPDYFGQLNTMRNALNSLGNNEAEMMLTEYSPYTPDNYQVDEPVEQAESAMTFFNALPGMLACPDLTHVTWAQFIDPTIVADRLGIITHEGKRKALYNAFQLYGMMPIDRRQMSISGGTLSGMASASDECVTAVVWNTETAQKSFNLTLTNISFTSGTLEVYHIDQTHNSYWDTKDDNLVLSSTQHVDITGKRLQLSDVVRNKGVCFVRLVADDAPALFPRVNLGNIMRTHQWFPTRTNEAAYALFDPKCWTVRLSSNQESRGRSLVGVEVERVPDYIHVAGRRRGAVSSSGVNSTINIRVDYQNTEGEYVHSVLYHAGQYREGRTDLLPWGTKRQPDEVIEVESLSDFTIDIVGHKPADAGKRVCISFDMAQVGTNVRQNFSLTKGQPIPTAIGEVEATDTKAAADARPSAIYSIGGQRLSHLASGLNIVRNADGKTKKILMR